MELNDKDNKIIDCIENYICELFGVSSEEIYAINATRVASLARAYLFYIIHIDLKYSIKCICDRYGRKKRSVFTAISKIKYLINNQKQFTAQYEEIKNGIKV